MTLCITYKTNTGQTKEFRLPPIDFTDKNRCTFSSSKIGQANAARDKLYDLRQCQLSGSDATGYDLSGVIMTKTDASKVKFQEAQFSKGYLRSKYIETLKGEFTAEFFGFNELLIFSSWFVYNIYRPRFKL